MLYIMKHWLPWHHCLHGPENFGCRGQRNTRPPSRSRFFLHAHLTPLTPLSACPRFQCHLDGTTRATTANHSMQACACTSPIRVLSTYIVQGGHLELMTVTSTQVHGRLDSVYFAHPTCIQTQCFYSNYNYGQSTFNNSKR